MDIFKIMVYQAWYLTEATEAIASVAPGLCLGALSKVPIEIYKFLIEVPFAKEKLPLQVWSIRPGILLFGLAQDLVQWNCHNISGMLNKFRAFPNPNKTCIDI